MKKMIVFLVISQILIIFTNGLVLIRGYGITSLINDGTTSLSLVFETPNEHRFFLDLADRKDLTITRPVFIDDTNLIIYTSDLLLDGRITLTSGVWPINNYNEFVSSVDTGEDNQVGRINNITPGFQLSLMSIEYTANIGLYGVYLINSIDQYVINSFVSELENNIYRVRLLSINNEVHPFGQVTIIQMLEFSTMSLLLFVSVLATLINYSISKLKVSSVFIVHGRSKFYAIRKAVLELSILLLLAFTTSYILIIAYSYFADFDSFLRIISISFIIISIFLFFIYLLISSIFIVIYLLLVQTTNILKGKKPYMFVQVANHITKTVFSITILISAFWALHNITELNNRSNAYSNWESARNVYTTRVYFVGQNDLEIDFEIMNRKLDFYENMSRNHNAFIMDSRNIYFLDLGLMPYGDMSTAPRMELSPRGYRITISPNFLEFNPIVTVNGIAIFEQIIYDPHVLNILVPEKLSLYENEILQLYLNYFYFSSVRIDNIYNETLGLELNTTPIDYLFVNIIYVQDDQTYFTFNTQIRPEEGNSIKNPIAVIYTGSVNPSRLSETMSDSFFFQTTAIDAHNAIMPLLVDSELSYVIRSVSSVFNENSRVIINIREQFLRAVVFIAILLISSFIILYALIANYFEKNRLQIFIKSVMGYNFIGRHLKFLILILFYNIGAMLLVSSFLGYSIFIFGLILGIVDVILIFVLDKKLTRSAFSKIMKGGY